MAIGAEAVKNFRVSIVVLPYVSSSAIGGRSPVLRCLPLVRPVASPPLSRFPLLLRLLHLRASLSPRSFLLPSRASLQTMSCVVESIQLTELERKIFDTLKAVLAHFHLRTQLRVAGGWVRDKLLGKECFDIDIALDNMLGKEFCEKLNEYLLSVGEEVRGVGVIQSNPDQSKHLETAKLRMFGVWIDFVNLRSETYADNSRIPTMEFGTAEEDAYRRDLTINSLFYNINTSSVEDLTGKGLSHLKDGIIATPLPPKRTFLDDPLRILRAIRFAARFCYKLQEDIREAVADKDVKDALTSKISRERVGHEVELMLMGDYPVKGIEEMVALDIFWTVFQTPKNIESLVSKDTDRFCLRTLEVVYEVMNMFCSTKFTAEQRRICYLGALLLPLRSYQYQCKKDKMVPLSSTIIKDSLKLKTLDAGMVVALHKAAENIWSTTGHLKEENLDAVAIGLVLMDIKDLWRVALLLSSVLELPARWTFELSMDDKRLILKERVHQCLALEAAITNLGLENVWERKPLLDGNTIMCELGLNRGGPEIKEWQHRLLKWQLGHLDGTADDCLEWFRNEKAKRQRSS